MAARGGADAGEVRLDGVSFRYAARSAPAIRDVGLSLRAGEFLLVTGPSGSGKTTLARCVNGIVPHFHEGELDGRVTVGGHDVAGLDIGEVGRMVGSVLQDPRSQFFMTDTTGEVAFGCANAGLPRDEVMRRADDAFRELGIDALRDRSLFELSSGEMQQVAIASCYAMAPSVYVFDEPSANLDMDAVARLRRILGELKRAGKTIVVLEHRLFYLAGLFDRMAVVEDGMVSGLYGPAEAKRISEEELGRRGLRRLRLETARPAGPVPPGPPAGSGRNSAASLDVRGLSFSYRRRGRRRDAASSVGGALGPVSFSARGGEVVGIVGENGAGKTTLSRLCCGLEREASGAIMLDGRPLSWRERLGTIRFIMQDSDYQLFSDSVWGELSMGPGVGGREGEGEDVLRRLGLWDLRDAHPASLSRGQKQRLTIACALVDDAAAYFFDEPTSGLDRANMAATAGLVRSLAAGGRVVFVVSHDYEFLLAACTRVLHLSGGGIVDDFPLDDGACARLAAALWKGGVPWDTTAIG